VRLKSSPRFYLRGVPVDEVGVLLQVKHEA
jgi:hypothetical protein